MKSWRWVEYVVRMEMRNACKIFVAKPEEKRPFTHLGIDGKIILKWILQK
jgi:hypothetical protein